MAATAIPSSTILPHAAAAVRPQPHRAMRLTTNVGMLVRAVVVLTGDRFECEARVKVQPTRSICLTASACKMRGQFFQALYDHFRCVD